MNSTGRALRFALFGESHGIGVGGVLDGIPPGTPIDEAGIERDMARRRPGRPGTSSRRESDRVEFLSGVHSGRATGAPLAFLIRNEDADGRPYGTVLRPGHADWTEHMWSRGSRDPRGGGHQSGRLTAPLVAAAAIAAPIMPGLRVAAHLHAVGDVTGQKEVDLAAMEAAMDGPFPTAHDVDMARVVEAARKDGDSVGGVVAFAAAGSPALLGGPHMEGVESRLAALLFAIPAVKGVGFGHGFDAARMRGSQHNDPLAVEEGVITAQSNHAGGILGGRTTGQEIFGKVAFKPTASIFKPQRSVDAATMDEVPLRLSGRHDPCIAVRAVPVVAACVRLVLLDLALEAGVVPSPS